MDSRECFESVCKFEKVKGPPIDYLAHYETDKKLKKHFDINTEEELLEKLGCDFFYLPCRDISQNEGFMKFYKRKLDVTDKERTCSLGIRWLRGAHDHKFSVDEAIQGPLSNAENAQDILNHKWPKPKDFDFSPLVNESEKHIDKVIVGGLWTGIMGDSYRLYGFEHFLMDIALKPHLIKTLVDKMTDVYLELNNAYFSKLKGKMDVWFFGNDFGSQNGLLVSPQIWYKFFFEDIKKLTSLAHSYGLKVMMHSCGAITEIIPYLIEAGVDILDPIQITAKEMSPENMSKKFGGKIVFHGGVDTQHVLPSSKPEEVKKHAEDVINVLGSKGGYIFAPSQILGPDIPVENIVAMYDAVKGKL